MVCMSKILFTNVNEYLKLLKIISVTVHYNNYRKLLKQNLSTGSDEIYHIKFSIGLVRNCTKVTKSLHVGKSDDE